MTVVAIDLWDKRVGIAIERENIAFPRDIIPRVEMISYLKKLVAEEEVSDIVVGLPYDLYGIDTKQLEKTQKTLTKLREIFPDITFHGHDERFSSFAADAWSSEHRDDVAAQHILQSFLHSNR